MRLIFSSSEICSMFGLAKSFVDDLVQREYVRPEVQTAGAKRAFNPYEAMIIWLIYQLREKAGYGIVQGKRTGRLMLATLMRELFLIQQAQKAPAPALFAVELMDYHIGYLAASEKNLGIRGFAFLPEHQTIFFTRAKEMKLPQESLETLKNRSVSFMEIKLTKIIDEGLKRLGVLSGERIPFGLDKTVDFYSHPGSPYVIAALAQEKVNCDFEKLKALPDDAEVEYVRA